MAIVEPEAGPWDALVERHPAGHLLQSSGWGVLKSTFGWHVRRVALAGAVGLEAGAQLLVRGRLGMSAAYVPRGPILAGDPAADRALLAAVERLARAARAVFLRIEPNVLETDPRADALHSFLLLAGFEPAEPIQPRSSVHLDLRPEPERLLAGMSKGHRADVRRAARDGVTVRPGAGSADLDGFYRIMEETAARAQFGIHGRSYYAEMLRLFGDEARLWLAEKQGSLQAAAITAARAGAGLYLYSGSSREGLKSGAQHAIQWQAVQWAREHGCRLYDFWGIPDALGEAASAPDEAARKALELAAESDPLYGVYRFKKGFGGQVVRYLPAYDRVYARPLYALWRRRLGG